LVVDLFPPGRRDPQGLPKVVWDEFYGESDYTLPQDKPLTLAAYVAGTCPEAPTEPTSVGAGIIDRPLFLIPQGDVPVPIQATYRAAFEAVPAYWRNVLTGPTIS